MHRKWIRNFCHRSHEHSRIERAPGLFSRRKVSKQQEKKIKGNDADPRDPQPHSARKKGESGEESRFVTSKETRRAPVRDQRLRDVSNARFTEIYETILFLSSLVGLCEGESVPSY